MGVEVTQGKHLLFRVNRNFDSDTDVAGAAAAGAAAEAAAGAAAASTAPLVFTSILWLQQWQQQQHLGLNEK